MKLSREFVSKCFGKSMREAKRKVDDNPKLNYGELIIDELVKNLNEETETKPHTKERCGHCDYELPCTCGRSSAEA